MEAKAETSNGPVVPKQEVQTPQGPKKNFNQNQMNQGGGPGGQRGGPKKNFQNRGGPMGNKQMGGNNRGPMKNEVSRKILCCSVFGGHFLKFLVGMLEVMSTSFL